MFYRVSWCVMLAYLPLVLCSKRWGCIRQPNLRTKMRTKRGGGGWGGRDFHRKTLIAGANSSERARFMHERRAYASVSIIKSCVITGGVTRRDEGRASPSSAKQTERSWIIGELDDMLILFRIRDARPRGLHYQRTFNVKRAPCAYKFSLRRLAA